MRTWFILLSLSGLFGCASTPKSGVKTFQCGSTPIQVQKLQEFGFEPRLGKITVMRVFATWCPYCKEDLTEIGNRFRSGQWTAEKVNILLLAYRNRAEDRSSFEEFAKNDFKKYGIPAGAAQLQYVDKEFNDLNRDPLFEGWKGVPFALIFGKDGRLAFRGHFTSSGRVQDGHYQFISEILNEKCG